MTSVLVFSAPGTTDGDPGSIAVSAKTELDISRRKKFTLQDLIDEEMLDCATNMEPDIQVDLVFVLHGFDKTWKSRDGQTWSIPRLITEELKAPIQSAAAVGIIACSV